MAPYSILIEFLKSSGSLQKEDFTREDIDAAFASLNADTGLAVLEKMIESPITGEWEMIISRLHPEWRHLDRWMRLSKLHCLAAVDALLTFCNSHELPKGADPPAIHAALDFALEQWGNPRLKDAAKKIRHCWPNGPRPKNEFTVSEPLARAAELLFRQDEKFKKGWLRSATYAEDAPKDQQALWELLIDYADKHKLVYSCDWNFPQSEYVWGLRHLYFVKELKFDWQPFAKEDGEFSPESWLCSLGTALRQSGETLVSLDHGCGDCYYLAVMPVPAVPEFTACLSTLDIPVVDLGIPAESQPMKSNATAFPAEFNLPFSSNPTSDGHTRTTTFFSTFWKAMLILLVITVLKMLGIFR